MAYVYTEMKVEALVLYVMSGRKGSDSTFQYVAGFGDGTEMATEVIRSD